MTEDEIADQLFNKSEYFRDNPLFADSFTIRPVRQRYNSIAKVEPSTDRLQELLYHRMHTARKILEHNTDNPIREMFVKYLEMIEQEIKKALILE